jgi:arabinogalactan oligomer/maltooligosaccharide transport system substrate-binding protein
MTVWAPVADMAGDNWLANRLDAFQAAHPEYEITWVTGVCEPGDAAWMLCQDPAKGPDVYFYANDQIGTLLSAGALAKLGGATAKFVKDNFSDTLINTVTYADGAIYGIPMSNSTYFMYYNKDIFTKKDVISLDKMLSKGKVAFPMNTAWYNGAFFLGNGCSLFGNGFDTSAGVQFANQQGYDAARAMLAFAQHPNFVHDISESGIDLFAEGKVGAVFSGSWMYDKLYKALGNKLGAAPLPTATIGGQQVQLRALASSTCLGVNRYAENTRLSIELVRFLASEESQLLRYQMRGVIPSIRGLADHSEIKADIVASAEMAVMNNCSVRQPVIPGMNCYWGAMSTFGDKIARGDITTDTIEQEVDQLNAAMNSNGL